jgi:hypothetical protein
MVYLRTYVRLPGLDIATEFRAIDEYTYLNLDLQSREAEAVNSFGEVRCTQRAKESDCEHARKAKQ